MCVAEQQGLEQRQKKKFHGAWFWRISKQAKVAGKNNGWKAKTSTADTQNVHCI
jgi:hypothetical protein